MPIQFNPLAAMRTLAMTKWPGHIVAFLAGLLFAFGLSPYNLWPLTLFSVVILLLLINPNDAKLSLRRGWYYGLGMFAHGMSWVYVSIHTFGKTPFLLAIQMTAIFIMGFALLFTIQTYLYVKMGAARTYILGFPTIWVLFDLFRSWFLTGCPWLFAGYAFIDSPLVGYAPIFGIYGVTFCAILSAALIAKLFENAGNDPVRHSEKLICLFLLVSIWAGGAALKNQVWVNIDYNIDNKIDVSLIQGNINQDIKWVPEQFEPTLKLYYDATDAELLDNEWQPDLILWPEAALPGFRHELDDYFQELEDLLLDEEASLITGILFATPERGDYIFQNSVIAVGEGKGIYHKQKLVPFGEVYPFTESLKSIIPFYGQMKSFTPGDNNQPLLTVRDTKVAPFICYEIIYPDFVRKNIKDADFLLTVSNDAWFGSSIAPWQHFEMARMRAIENGRYIIRGTNTGVTGIISHKGEVISMAPQFEQLAHRGSIHRASGTTPYTEFGNQPILLITSLLFGLSVILGNIRRNK